MGIEGKHVGRVKCERCAHRAANLRTIMDDLRSQGIISVRSVTAQLNERGVLTARGGSWHPTSAARLLSRLQS